MPALLTTPAVVADTDANGCTENVDDPAAALKVRPAMGPFIQLGLMKNDGELVGVLEPVSDCDMVGVCVGVVDGDDVGVAPVEAVSDADMDVELVDDADHDGDTVAVADIVSDVDPVLDRLDDIVGVDV